VSLAGTLSEGDSCRERSQGDLPGRVPTSSADGLPIASPLTVAAWRNAQSTKRALHKKTLTVRFFRFISEVALPCGTSDNGTLIAFDGRLPNM
jgi:hypothetical protein